MKQLKLKVCGMKDAADIQELVEVKPTFIGFIFYKKSPRFVSELAEESITSIPNDIKKVGVFVSEELETILSVYDSYGLDYVQLHGNESLELSKQLKAKGCGIIKVFSVTDHLPESLDRFAPCSDYFLFDTATTLYGGSGRHFDWSILSEYNLPTPFLLSGGIGLDDIDEIKKLDIQGLAGIDVNSKFEIAPGKKDMDKVRSLKTAL